MLSFPDVLDSLAFNSADNKIRPNFSNNIELHSEIISSVKHSHIPIDNWKKRRTFPIVNYIFTIDWIFTFLFRYFFIRRIYIKILNQEYKVFYIGTNTGRIYKIVQFIQNGESKSTLLDIFEVAQNEAIQVMQISQKRKSLYVSTDHRIKQIDLAMCSRRYDSCFRCVKDPYCGWDEGTNSCKPYELGLLQVSFIASVLSYRENFFLCAKLRKCKKYTQQNYIAQYNTSSLDFSNSPGRHAGEKNIREREQKY